MAAANIMEYNSILGINPMSKMRVRHSMNNKILQKNQKYLLQIRTSVINPNPKYNLRCFACRLSSRCDDIDPGLNAPSPSFPNGFKWINLLVCSYVLKLIDCVIIGSTTLTFGTVRIHFDVGNRKC